MVSTPAPDPAADKVCFGRVSRPTIGVQLNVSSSREVSGPKVLFQTRAVQAKPWTNDRNAYVSTPDGQRFLVNVPVEDQSDSITVVVNWTAALPR